MKENKNIIYRRFTGDLNYKYYYIMVVNKDFIIPRGEYCNYLDAVHALSKYIKKYPKDTFKIVQPLISFEVIETTEQDFKDDEESYVDPNNKENK